MTAALHMGHELILGGARSGKSRTAEARAAAWLARSPRHEATLIATALAGDADMSERIRRHRSDRAARVPALTTVEAPTHLPAALRAHTAAHRLIVVDCLTLWLTQCWMPPLGAAITPDAWQAEVGALQQALHEGTGPVVLVSNEIGLGVMPVSREARRCVDALGLLHQQVAAQCTRVTLMVAGCELALKGGR
jgi:adenosylcobinamide kinase/adenosylcobinamide-phosphate guanylyltransferase